MSYGSKYLLRFSSIANEIPILIANNTQTTGMIDLLIAHKGFLDTSMIIQSLNTTPPTARRIMAELKAVELVDLKEPETETEQKEITLKEDFEWFLSFSSLLLAVGHT